MTAAPTTIFSIGHGNRSASDFVAQLRAAGVVCLVDVRAYPASRRHPQFSRMVLEPALRSAGIRYLWEGQALGGMRSPQPQSRHLALSDPAMRGFADHTEVVVDSRLHGKKHLEILSEIAEMLSDTSMRERLKKSGDAKDLHQLIVSWQSTLTV